MKKIIILLLMICLVFPIFSQTVEELKEALSKTTVLVEKLIAENEAKDITIAEKEKLIQEAIALMEKKDKTIADLNVTISTLTTDNNKTIEELNKMILEYKGDIKELRKIIDDFIRKYNTLSKTNILLLEVGYNTQGNFIGGIDYSFALWRFRFLTGVTYETPITFGVKIGFGVSL